MLIVCGVKSSTEGSNPSVSATPWLRKQGGSPDSKGQKTRYAAIAQLDRASDYGSEGWGFDSSWPRHIDWTYSPHHPGGAQHPAKAHALAGCLLWAARPRGGLPFGMAPRSGPDLHARLVTLLESTGPRPSCSPAERALGERLAADWAGFADTVRREPFRCHPDAFLGFIAPACLVSIAAAVLLVVGHPGAAAALGAGAAAVTIAELLLYKELVDRLFPAAEGVNVAAVVAPRGERRQRILLTAHLDSAWEFNVWWWFKGAGPIVNVLGLGACLVPALVGPLAVAGVIPADTAASAGLLGLACAPFTLANVFFHTRRAVPGAMDDLAGLVCIGEAGRVLAGAGLQHTELVVLACSSEECGLRGAKRYAEAHAAEHAALPTLDINVDGVYDEAFLTAITRELTTGVTHDAALIALAARCAGDRGQALGRGLIPFGGTDGAAFAQAGLRTLALLAQDTRRLAPNYHTRLDTPERVRPEALAVMRDLVVDVVQSLDAAAAASPAPPAGR